MTRLSRTTSGTLQGFVLKHTGSKGNPSSRGRVASGGNFDYPAYRESL
jgi:hypothetical protein